MTTGIFRIVGPHGRAFVGQALDIERRFYGIYWELRQNRHYCDELQKSWNENPNYPFRFEIIGSTPVTGNTRYILEQFFLDQSKNLYNESKKIYRTCAYYPKETVTQAMETFIATGMVHLITPSCEWKSLENRNYGWSAQDCGSKDDNWFVGFVTDSKTWLRNEPWVCDRFNVLTYNPIQEFKRLGADRWTGQPRNVKMYSPYIFCRLNKDIGDLYRLAELNPGMTLMLGGKPLRMPIDFIDDTFKREESGEFISTQANREKAIQHNNLKGATFIKTDGDKAIMSLNGKKFELLMTEMCDLYRQAS